MNKYFGFQLKCEICRKEFRNGYKIINDIIYPSDDLYCDCCQNTCFLCGNIVNKKIIINVTNNSNNIKVDFCSNCGTIDPMDKRLNEKEIKWINQYNYYNTVIWLYNNYYKNNM